jgi:hypothetical protein
MRMERLGLAVILSSLLSGQAIPPVTFEVTSIKHAEFAPAARLRACVSRAGESLTGLRR